MRKNYPYLANIADYVDCMEMISLQTSELKTILQKDTTHSTLYNLFKNAYNIETKIKDWYKTAMLKIYKKEKKMEKYLNINGDSNVESYEICLDRILIKFYRTNKIYVYSYRSAGVSNVEKMKLLAKKGDGLNSYVIRNCKTLYEK